MIQELKSQKQIKLLKIFIEREYRPASDPAKAEAKAKDDAEEEKAKREEVVPVD